MNAYSSTGDEFSHRVEEWMESIQAELRDAVRYVDAVVIPEVRRESAGALRVMAGHLDRLADKLDPTGKRAQ